MIVETKPTLVTVVEVRGFQRSRLGRRWIVVGSCGHRSVVKMAKGSNGPLGASYICPLCPGGWAGPTVREAKS